MQDIRYEISESKLSCYADPVRVKQILVNLLGNAIKFTPGGGTVGLEASLIMDDRAVQFTVWDTGCGIEPEDQLRIFRPFTQLDHGLSRRHAGTGLGLTLVRQFVEMHGGTVRVESQVGAGSRFTLTLPRDIRTEGISETGRPTRAEGILVANS
jgi:signal transduction histidine kinase